MPSPENVRLTDVAEVNPHASLGDVPLDELVAFVPMSAMSAEHGVVTATEHRNLGDVRKGFTPFHDGDVLIAKITPCFENGKIGQVRIPTPIGFGSTEFHVVRPHLGRLDGRYLHHFLRQDRVRHEGERRMTGSAGQRRVPAAFVSNLRLCLPPVPQQRRIADILDKADALRAQRRAALAELDTLTQSIFLDLFGDPSTNVKEWEMRPFGEVCETRLGKMLDQKQKTGKNLRPYLRNANVQWFRFDLSEIFEMDFDSAARKIFLLEQGDLLICEGGRPGRTAIWQGQIEECYYQKALHRARPRPDLAAPDYLAWLLWFLVERGSLADHVTSATIAHLTGEKLKAMNIPLPPLKLQRDFARRITAIETLKSRHRAALAELDTLFASIQHRAFRGELSGTSLY